ncbi:membrane protein [Pandoraea bronchicola]|uniref:Membrane protein n=2 Tax=Pandoraea bronchicola TaxID=2508287 RepID=A0A5E5BZ97_9BURK|nr:membrane protein [Pandoraea bronchicola]
MATVWCGSQWAIGYIVAPTLFAVLESRTVAGTVAGRLFHTQAWLSLVCGVLLVWLATALIARTGDERAARSYRGLRWLAVAMMVCVLISWFGLQPFMADLRAQAQASGVEIGQSPLAARFGMLHGISSGIYLLQSLLGIALIWRQPVRG